jgi:hypothetical protein
MVDSVNKKKSKISAFYHYFRESHIEEAYLVCFHYRLISVESCERKIKTNIYYETLNIDDLLECDYCEINDTTIYDKMNFIK